ncbi:uncharacterized protein [Nicotiana sylvestris]|uniref:uncharacterized protein n=1 Tax=Nicotiana sylvestris TaxID=4096 RepID=UPI00388CADE0
MTTIFHDMIHKKIEVYMDDVIIKSMKQSNHVSDLRKFFQRLHRYNLKLSPTKYAFGVPSGKLLGFIVSQRGIELDPSKNKSIQELPPLKNKIEVMSPLGRLNYISRFIAHLTITCRPIFKLLKKDDAVKWTDECQEAFDKIKEYLSNPHVWVLSEHGRLLILYLTVLDNSFGYVLEVMHIDEVGKDEKPGWKLFFDGAANMKGVGIRAVLISEIGHYYPITAQLRFYCTNNMAKYKFRSIEFRNIPRIHNEVADALATLASMLHHPDKTYVDPLHIQVRDRHAYCNVVEEELDSEPWFHDIREYIRMGVHKDLIHSPPSELHTMSTPSPFVAWDMDIIGPIEPAASNGHSHLMKEVCQQFKITHRNSTPYLPKENVVVEVANKNIKKILQKMVQGSMQWHKKLPFALLGYRTTVHTSVGTTPYLFVYGTEAVIPVEVEIISLRIITKAEIDDDQWVKNRLEKLSLIDEKRLAAMCHGQFYQKRMTKVYNKKMADTSRVSDVGSSESLPITVDSNTNTIDTQDSKKRKAMQPRSDVWNHFDKFEVNGVGKVQCRYCKQAYAANSSKNGTTGLKNHLLRCKEYPLNIAKDNSQTLLNF